MAAFMSVSDMRRVSPARIVLRLAHGLGEYLVGRLDPGEGRGASVPPAAAALDGGGEGRTLSKLPRRMAWRDRIPNHVLTWFVQDAEVGVKWNVKRGCRASQATTSGVLWVDELSRMTWTSPAG